MNQIVGRLRGHISADHQPMPRGPAPRDDTLERVLDEIQRLRRRLVEHRARDIEMRRLLMELAKSRRRVAELESRQSNWGKGEV
jgi:hypothetical protein